MAHGSVLAAIEEQLDGEAELDSLSFSWSGHIDMAGLRFTDARGEEVFSVEKVALEIDVWAAMGGAYHFTANVENPRLTVHRRADGTLNLQEMQRLYLRDGKPWSVSDEPDSDPQPFTYEPPQATSSKKKRSRKGPGAKKGKKRPGPRKRKPGPTE